MGDYFLGLDMGTSSIGWAVATPDYELVRRKGKDLWGIREFEEAQTAEKRRINRVSRRRRQKEVVRLGLLKTYFADEIEKIDHDFYTRLDNSKYFLEDKNESVKYKYSIFNDENYTDVDYYKQYPTIFHLRKELIENTNEHDIRLVYLAICNLFKHRGHFLNENLSSADNKRSVQVIYDAFIEEVMVNVINPDTEEGVSFISVDALELENILADKNISRKAKQEKLCILLSVDKKDKIKNEYVKCICGLKTDGKKLFPSLEVEDKLDICFSDFGYEEKIPEIIEIIGEDNYRILELMKELYDDGILASILKGRQYISVARVEQYEKHANDLRLLKKVVRESLAQADYDFLFRSEEKGSYSAYINSNLSRGRKTRRGIGSYKAEELYNTLTKMLKNVETDEAKYILNEISNENFLPKQISNENGVIPNQVHKAELKKILDNAERYLPFLTEVDESNLSVSQRILELFSFHIPYYIGPVTERSEQNGGNGWVVRKNAGDVLPWNYKEKIDVSKTSELFIRRMVRNCTYIRDEKVLPKCSLMYESYAVLNEINNIKINGERIDNDIKKDIYESLFKNGKRITKKALCKYLFTKGIIENENQITGIDTNINNYLPSYGKLKSVFGTDIEKDSVMKMAERIIFLGTVYGDSKSLYKDAIEKEYGEVLSDSQIKRILGFKFKDWGRLSEEFLNMEGVNVETGEILSLYQALWETNLNLMELLHKEEYGFKESLDKKVNTVFKDINDVVYDDLEEYYFSAPVKRMVWQSLLLIKEIKEVMGSEPAKIFIEMTREDDEKGDRGRKSSRKKKFIDLYSSIRDETHDWVQIIESSELSGRLKSKKMYLYLTQMGKDMYSGEEIDLDELFNDNIYNIDHIYPQSITKDDSLENNLVLVHGNLNRDKSNEYPLNVNIRGNIKVQNHWKVLHEKGFINDEKYNRLTSRNSLTEEQLAGFIARQIVETSQATKGVADILKGVCPNSELVYSKAGNVSRFREKYGFLKSRTVNEFHHANDAYLNIVVGNAYNIKFTNSPMNFIKNEYSKDPKKYAYHMTKMFEHDIKRGNSIGWISSKEGNSGTISTVRKVMLKNTPIMTMMELEGVGELFNLQPKGHKEAKMANYAPLKSTIGCMSQVEKYGGYGSLKPAYFVFLEYGPEKKRKKAFDVVPMIYKDRIDSVTSLAHYYEDNGYENVRVIVPKIKRNSLIKIDGYYVYLVGMDSRKNVELHNAVNLKVNTQGGCFFNNYIHDIEKAVENGNISIDSDDECNKNTSNRVARVAFSKEANEKLYDFIIDKYSIGMMKNYPKNIASILLEGRDKFTSLSLSKQVEILYKILTISSINGKVTELKEIGGPSSDVGRIRISGNMTDRNEVMLVKQSISGIYEKSFNLMQL